MQSRAALRAFPGRASEAIERAAERPGRRVREQIPLVEIRDMGRSLAFYVDLLGFRVVSRWPDDEPVPGWAALAAGAARIMLRTGARPPRTPGGAVTLNLYVEGIDAFRDSIAAAGVRCGPVRSLFYGAREFSLRDPEGNEIAIVEFGASEPGYLASSTDGDEKDEEPNEGG